MLECNENQGKGNNISAPHKTSPIYSRSPQQLFLLPHHSKPINWIKKNRTDLSFPKMGNSFWFQLQFVFLLELFIGLAFSKKFRWGLSDDVSNPFSSSQPFQHFPKRIIFKRKELEMHILVSELIVRAVKSAWFASASAASVHCNEIRLVRQLPSKQIIKINGFIVWSIVATYWHNASTGSPFL